MDSRLPDSRTLRHLSLDLSFRNPVLPAGALAVAIWLIWAAINGGFAPTQWGLVGAALAVLLAVATIASPPRVAIWGRGRIVMLSALLAFVAWNYLSILWADVPADAWSGADKTLLYAAGFALFAMWPWTPKGVVAILGLFALGAEQRKTESDELPPSAEQSDDRGEDACPQHPAAEAGQDIEPTQCCHPRQ